MRLPIVLAALLAPVARAQAPLNAPVPLAASARSELAPPAFGAAAAQRAQDLGFPSTAANLYRTLLAQQGADAPRLTLALASALLEAGDVEAAARALDGYSGPKNSAYHLRRGLVAAYRQHLDSARSDLSSVKQDELPAEDRGWTFFLEGMIADASANPGESSALYQKAAASAVSTLQRARFLLAEEQARLRFGSVSKAQIEEDRRSTESHQGQRVGYSFARAYAVALDAAGKKPQAVEVLQAQLRALPAAEKGEGDQFRLLLGLISGPSEGAGRHALFELLAEGTDPDRQRMALELLARGSATEAARAELRRALDALIAQSQPHPILEALLFFRSSLALGDKDYARAEEDAHALLERYPGSPLKSDAYAVLAGSAWEQRRYRTAADYATHARAEMPAGLLHAEFGVLVAEAWYRAGDFSSAASAYEAALHEPPSGITAAALIFQRIQSEIEEARQSGDFSHAQAALDASEHGPGFDSAERWEAEWNLARALESRRQVADAYARVSKLLAEPSSALPADLRARMSWLKGRLAFDLGRPAEALEIARSLGSLSGIAAALEAQIASNVALLEAQANFELGHEQTALDILKKLRGDYPSADAAVYSYIVEADHYAEQDKIADAQRLLTRLSDDFPSNYYAPYALYQAALQAERLGQDKNLEEAYRLLESLVTKPWTGDAVRSAADLTFYARLRQGDLLRKLNQFPQAQQIYESLVNASGAPESDSILARLALAECHNAQSANDPLHADSASRIFEDLVERVDAPTDIRVEAGYSLGDLLERRGAPDKAQALWWADVIDPFLVRSNGAGLAAKGRWWMARTLLHSGDLYKKGNHLDEACRAWQLVIASGLPGSALAKDRLDQFHLPAAAR